LTDADGKEVNHQYSKSLAFELDFRRMVKQRVSAGVEYFSLLRPYNVVAISHLFASMTQYHQVFSSCNRNFHLDGSRIEGRWCRNCPKCRFAALALAPFMTPEQLIEIQGGDLLNNETQLSGYQEICGLGEDKPFECVGGVSESRAAMKVLTLQPQWAGKAVVQEMAKETDIQQAGDLQLKPDFAAPHCIPVTVLRKMNAL
jgi:hypothetical protein